MALPGRHASPQRGLSDMADSGKCCAICKQRRSLEQFNRKQRSPDGLQPHCRECNRLASRAYYQRSRAKHLRVVQANKIDYVARNREVLFAHLLAHPCVDCGESDPLVLDFDHVRGQKVGEVTRMAAHASRPTRLRAEIDKCEIRCVNCHRRRTGIVQRSWRTKLR